MNDPIDPVLRCRCGRDLVIREGVLKLSYGPVKTVSHFCPACGTERLDGLPWTRGESAPDDGVGVEP
jgi:hypothetical protein